MHENLQSLPLAPSQDYPKRDMESGILNIPKKPRQKKSSKFPVCLLAGIVIICAVVLTFASIVLRPRNPDVKISSVAVKKLVHGTSSSPFFNITLVAEITVKNTNFGNFKFQNTTGSIYYGSEVVGNLSIPEGRAGARAEEKINVTADVKYHGGSGMKNLSSDINLGLLELNSVAKLSGRVRLLKIMEKTRTQEMNCIIILDLNRDTVDNLACN
ncbi:hypothetical protein SLE2022_229490 [Rubroshorea leprosula]